jgi:hypothetical protein
VGGSKRAAIDGDLDMGKAAVSLAAAIAGLGVLFLASPSEAQLYNSHRSAWMVAPGYFGFSSYPWPGPPFAWPTLRPTYGCYFTRARLQNAWRQVEVCS